MKLEARGKFLYLGEEKFFPKAVYVDGSEPLSAGAAESGADTVWLGDPTPERAGFFARQGLKVVARLDLETYLGHLFAGEASAARKWRDGLRARVEAIRGEPALLAYDLGGPVPEPVRQWLGERGLEGRLRDVFDAVKAADPGRPATFTNSSGSSFGHGFLDFFSVELEEESLAGFRVALSRLQNRAGGYPLVVRVSEADRSLDGESERAHAVDQRVRMSFQAGCAGAVVGKQALAFARAAFAESPFPHYFPWPRVSVVVCVYNGEKFIEECLDGAGALDYPDFEVLVVDDGSTDRTRELAEAKAARYGFQVLALPRSGLSFARNAGMDRATGEIIAYLDSDAFPDPLWLRYLAMTFRTSKHAVVGGPNLNPPASGAVSDCIDQAPGNPQIVMSNDELADHIPGCNLAVRRSFMKSIGGFDPSYRGGGDDVHFCWRVLRLGGTLGPSHGAMVWHYRRNTVGGFLRQQAGYGRGEAALEKDWPERFNSLGHQVKAESGLGADAAPWTPSIYLPPFAGASTLMNWLGFFPSMPEWPLVVGVFAALSALGAAWRPFLVFLPFFVLGLIVWLAYAATAAAGARLRRPSPKSRAVVAFLFLAQPIARVYGRLSSGLAPWRRGCPGSFVFPRPEVLRVEVPGGISKREGRTILGAAFKARSLPAVSGEGGGWDWTVSGGLFGGVRCLLNVDDAGVSLRVWPYVSAIGLLLGAIAGVAAAAAFASDARVAGLLLAAPLAGLGAGVLRHAGAAMGSLRPVLLEEELWAVSPWDRCRPPSRFFEKLPAPSGRGRV